MYERVWSKSGHQIVSLKSNEPKQTPSRLSRSRMPAPNSTTRIERKVWRDFVTTGKSDISSMNPSIRDSWLRCRKLGVDPALGKCQEIRNTRELGPEFNQLGDIVAEPRAYISDLIKGRGLLVTISDRQGYLISMCGDYRPLLSAGKLNFGPGANWSEGSVGTNAIGTALATGKAITVSGSEHFCEDHHAWICSAAPIFDLYGGIIGSIDISGPIDANHSNALTLAIKGARAVESQMIKHHAAELQKQSSRILASAFNVVATGLMVIDINGVITTVNPMAEVLFECKKEELIGRPVGRYFEIERVLRHLRRSPNRYSASGIRLAWRGKEAATARIYPIITPNGSMPGLLLVLSEQQTYHQHVSLPIETFDPKDPFNTVVGVSSAIQRAIESARRVACSNTTTLITGESGTGKEVIAKAIHRASSRSKRPFLAVNCGAIPAELIQSELFGYAQGAFTGARRSGNPGKFEQATGGTLFLDEIAEMPLNLQVNLLRVLEERQITRIGANRPVPVDVRIIAATNKDLQESVRRKAFREDLFYRLKVVKIGLPPLRWRGQDLDLLADHFIDQMSKKLNRKITRVEASFYEFLHQYTWPGNVRELKHAIEGAIALMPGTILSGDCLGEDIAGCSKIGRPTVDRTGFNLSMVEKATIKLAHTEFCGNITRMAKALGIGRNTLYAKLRKYGIS